MKRTLNRRFISERVKVDKDHINSVILGIKHKKCLTWKQLARMFDVSEHVMRYEWRHAKTTVPRPVVKKLERLSSRCLRGEILPIWWGQKTGQKSKFEPIVKLPLLKDKKFAEFYGVMLGDGCIYSTGASFCITCNSSSDKDYVEDYLSRLCYALFHIHPKMYYAKNEKAIRLVVNSVKISKFLIENGFPIGKKKKSKIRIPDLFFKNPQLATALLRGLIDTDGGVHPHPHTKIMMAYCSIIPELLQVVNDLLNSFEIKASISGNKLQIYGRDKLARYFSIVGSSNPRNIIRYMNFLQTGITPSAIETERLLKEQMEKIPVPYHGPVV